MFSLDLNFNFKNIMINDSENEIKEKKNDNISKSLDDLFVKIEREYEINQENYPLDIKYFVKSYSPFLYDGNNKISVSKVIPIDTFKIEYKDKEYIKTLESFQEKFKVKGIRKIRGDGNCLYRSYIFQYIEIILIKCPPPLAINLLKNLFNKIMNTSFDENKYIHFNNFFKMNNKSINDAKINCLMILKKLISLISENASKKSIYQFFIINYSMNLLFDNYLICWLRAQYEKYLSTYENSLIKNEFSVSMVVLANEQIEFLNENEQHNSYLKYVNERILKIGEDGECIVNLLFPILFGIETRVINLTKSQKTKKLEVFEDLNKNFIEGLDYLSNEDEIIIKELSSLKLNLNVFRRDNHYDVIYDHYTSNILISLEENIEKFNFPEEKKKKFYQKQREEKNNSCGIL